VNRELLELAGELHAAHKPFVLATVVWSRSPTSGKSGSTAIIEPDGHMHGWIGGACAEPAVIREARKVLADGAGRLMYLGPAEELDGSNRDGVVTVPIACASEGALEVYMEPVLPQPHVVVVGDTPAVTTLAGLLEVLDWRVSVVSDDVAALLASLDIDSGSAVVVASQGHYDEPALEAALATPAGYVGLIASERRSENVLGYLRDRGVEEAQLRRVRVPAGLDLGHIEHREIAVAVLAELVELRASGALGAGEVPSEAPAEAIDPVCGMTVEIATARWSTEHDGKMYYFCAPGCQKAFEGAPAEFVSAGA
jgi:xanthine dehydrogenase accessory factor